MGIDPDISKAWQQAAADLGIRVVAPFTLTMADGQALEFEAHVLDFGSRTGAIAMSQESRKFDEMAQLGHWCSVLTESYRTYDRQFFIDTLNDWGWFGDAGNTPKWYSGKPWSG
jgi:hypothetical protein